MTPSPPRVVQLACPVTTPAIPPSSGRTLPVPAVRGPGPADKVDDVLVFRKQLRTMRGTSA